MPFPHSSFGTSALCFHFSCRMQLCQWPYPYAACGISNVHASMTDSMWWLGPVQSTWIILTQHITSSFHTCAKQKRLWARCPRRCFVVDSTFPMAFAYLVYVKGTTEVCLLHLLSSHRPLVLASNSVSFWLLWFVCVFFKIAICASGVWGQDRLSLPSKTFCRQAFAFGPHHSNVLPFASNRSLPSKQMQILSTILERWISLSLLYSLLKDIFLEVHLLWWHTMTRGPHVHLHLCRYMNVY